MTLLIHLFHSLHPLLLCTLLLHVDSSVRNNRSWIRLVVQEMDLIAFRLPRLVSWVIAGGTASLARGIVGYLLSHAGGFMLVRFVGSARHCENQFRYNLIKRNLKIM
jgi:hypothetical protein